MRNLRINDNILDGIFRTGITVRKNVVMLITALVILLLPYLIFAQPTYQLVHDGFRDGKQYAYLDIACSNESNCTVVGFVNNPTGNPYSRVIERTTDGGITWTIQQSGLPDYFNAFENARLNKVVAIDSLNVVIVGDSGIILRTINAGNTWIRQSSGVSYKLSDVSFIDSANGTAVGGVGLILATTDAGTTWRQINGLPIVYFSSCKVFTSKIQSAFKYGYGPIFHTSDGWVTWDTTASLLDPLNPDYKQVARNSQFLDPQKVIAYGSHKTKDNLPNLANCYIRGTTDGGRSWTTSYDMFESRISYELRMLLINKSGIGLASGTGDRGMLYTIDGGKNWISDSVNLESRFTDFAAVSNSGGNNFFMIGTQLDLLGGVIKVGFHSSKVESYEQLKLGTHVYPNPANNSFTIYSNSGFDVSFELYDMLGRLVRQAHPAVGGKFVLNTDDIASGAYRLIAKYNNVKISVTTIVIIHS